MKSSNPTYVYKLRCYWNDSVPWMILTQCSRFHTTNVAWNRNIEKRIFGDKTAINRVPCTSFLWSHQNNCNNSGHQPLWTGRNTVSRSRRGKKAYSFHMPLKQLKEIIPIEKECFTATWTCMKFDQNIKKNKKNWEKLKLLIGLVKILPMHPFKFTGKKFSSIFLLFELIRSQDTANFS